MDGHRGLGNADQSSHKENFGFSLRQQRVFTYIRECVIQDSGSRKLYEFKISDFCEASGTEIDGMKIALKELADQSIWVDTLGAETLLRPIKKAYIDEKNGVIRVVLDEDVMPFYLLQGRS